MALIVKKLEQSHQLKHFDCGDEKLNEYLRRYAIVNQERHMHGTTYVAFLPPHEEVIGYYTLCTSGIQRADLPFASVLGQPKYPQIPCILLARLAIAKKHQGKRYGEELLRRSLTIALLAASHCNARHLIADAYPSKASWYELYGFIAIPGGTSSNTQKMFLDLKKVKAAVSKGRDG